jgi:hypothetical protein
MGHIIRTWVLFLFFLQRSLVFAVIEPTVVPQGSELDDPLYYTGAIEADFGNGTSLVAFGSGAVAEHPRIVLSCAHLNYTKEIGWFGVGATRWFLHWNQSDSPSNVGASGLTMSGFYRFNKYASLRDADPNASSSRNVTFAQDYVVHYHVSQNTANGYFAPLLDSGAEFLVKNSFMKKISGYPIDQYSSGDPLNYQFRMHETVAFANKATVGYGPYMMINGVTSYRGNSGGPIWGWIKGRWVHAGVVVGVGKTSLGVVGNHPSGMNLIFSALKDQFPDSPIYQNSFAASGVGDIPDAGTLTKTFTVANIVGRTQSIQLNLNIQHPRRGDLVITLRSPEGRTVTVLQSVPIAKPSRTNLIGTLDVFGYKSSDPYGTWTLTIKDVYRTKTGTLLAAGMDITTQ